MLWAAHAMTRAWISLKVRTGKTIPASQLQDVFEVLAMFLSTDTKLRLMAHPISPNVRKINKEYRSHWSPISDIIKNLWALIGWLMYAAEFLPIWEPWDWGFLLLMIFPPLLLVSNRSLNMSSCVQSITIKCATSKPCWNCLNWK